MGGRAGLSLAIPTRLLSIRSSAWEKTAAQEGGSNERATCENVFIVVVVDACLA